MQTIDAPLGCHRKADAIDEPAFAALIQTEWLALVRMARSVVGDLEAEDVVQEGLLVAWKKRRNLRDPQAFVAWVRRIIFRRCLSRARRRRPMLPLEEVELPSAPAATTSPVWSVLGRLAPRQRAVMHLTVMEGMTDREIATILRMRPATVRAHRRRARERLRRILEDQEVIDEK